MFGESVFVPRKTAKKRVEEAKAPKLPESEWLREKRERAEHQEPKTSAFLQMALRAQQDRQPAPIEMTEAERRENAVIAKFEAATPEQQAAMIVKAASKGVRFRRDK